MSNHSFVFLYSLNLILLTFPIFKHHINGIILCIFFCVCFFFLFSVASCSFIVFISLWIVLSLLIFLPRWPPGCFQSLSYEQSCHGILSHVFRHDCERVFLEHWLFFKTMHLVYTWYRNYFMNILSNPKDNNISCCSSCFILDAILRAQHAFTFHNYPLRQELLF